MFFYLIIFWSMKSISLVLLCRQKLDWCKQSYNGKHPKERTWKIHSGILSNKTQEPRRKLEQNHKILVKVGYLLPETLKGPGVKNLMWRMSFWLSSRNQTTSSVGDQLNLGGFLKAKEWVFLQNFCHEKCSWEFEECVEKGNSPKNGKWKRKPSFNKAAQPASFSCSCPEFFFFVYFLSFNLLCAYFMQIPSPEKTLKPLSQIFICRDLKEGKKKNPKLNGWNLFLELKISSQSISWLGIRICIGSGVEGIAGSRYRCPMKNENRKRKEKKRN